MNANKHVPKHKTQQKFYLNAIAIHVENSTRHILTKLLMNCRKPKEEREEREIDRAVVLFPLVSFLPRSHKIIPFRFRNILLRMKFGVNNRHKNQIQFVSLNKLPN